MPDLISSFGNLEVLSVREEGGEDVVHLLERAEDDESCENDCMTYSGWTEDGAMKCSTVTGNDDEPERPKTPEDFPEEEIPEKRSLQKRRKPFKLLCKGLNIANRPDGFGFQSPTWPDTNDLQDAWKTVYDTGDPRKPTEIEWFKLKRLEKKWKDDVVAEKGDRCYDAEHVLEWQMLQDFVEDDIAKGDQSRCAFLLKYFQKEMELKDIEVKVPKYDKDVEKGKNFETEKKAYKWSKWVDKKQKIPRAIDWVARQWPGTGSDEAKPPNPWEQELVVCNADVNQRKENVWSKDKDNIFVKPKASNNNELNKNKKNSGSLEALYANKKLSKDKAEDWPKNRGRCKAVYKFNTIMAIAQYHNLPYVRAIMAAQVNRVGDAFKYLEENIVNDVEWEDANNQKHKFQKRNLKKEWMDFMTEVHKERLTKLQKALDEGIKVFKGTSQYTVPKKRRDFSYLKRWDFSNLFSKRAGNKDLNCGEETDQAVMKKRVDLLIKMYDEMDKVDTTLKLD